MSDSYRPPPGPKGPRGAPPPKANWSNPNRTLPPNGAPQKRYKERDIYRPNVDKPRQNPYPESRGSDRPSGPSAYSAPRKRTFPEPAPNGNKRRDFTRDDSRIDRDDYRARDDRRPEREYSRQDYRQDYRSRPDTARDSRDTVRDSRDSVREARDSVRETRDSVRDVRDGARDAREGAKDRDARQGAPRESAKERPANTHPKNARESRQNGPRAEFRGRRPVEKPKEKRPKKPAPRLSRGQIYSVYSSRTTELYKRVQQVGEGTYGKVYKAKNEVTNESVALKKLRLESEREGFPITAMREIKLLQSFDHPNIVGLLEMMVEHNQITMIFDYLDHDLTGLLTLPDLVLSEGHRKMMFKQLMDGLHYLHRRSVIHRDIKGSNILLNSHGVLKIADFGLARNMKVLRAGESPDYTNRVITIWYRPPELLMGSTDYGREIDVWGVGCLLMELYTKTAVFQGAEEISQLFKIYEIMGTPTTESWPQMENLPWFEMLKPRVNRTSTFEAQFRSVMTEDSFDLAKKMLTLCPSERITAEEALAHPYFHNDPQPEPLTFMATLEGEWHEFETKKRRREERKRLQNLKARATSIPKSTSQTPRFEDDNDSNRGDESERIDAETESNEPNGSKQEFLGGEPRSEPAEPKPETNEAAAHEPTPAVEPSVEPNGLSAVAGDVANDASDDAPKNVSSEVANAAPDVDAGIAETNDGAETAASEAPEPSTESGAL